MTDDPRPPAPTPQKAGVQGGDRDVSSDQQPPSTDAAPQGSGEGGLRGEEHRKDERAGGMGGEGA